MIKQCNLWSDFPDDHHLVVEKKMLSLCLPNAHCFLLTLHLSFFFLCCVVHDLFYFFMYVPAPFLFLII